MGKKATFPHLYHLFHLYFHIYHSFTSSFFSLFVPPPPPPFCFVCCSSSYEPEMLLWRFHKELRFQPLLRRMALAGGGGGGGVWGYFKSCFLMLLSHRPPTHTPPFFSTQPSHPPLTAITGVMAGCEDRE